MRAVLAVPGSLALAAAAPGNLFRRILPWLVALALLVVAAAVVIWLIRRAIRPPAGDSGGFSLQELRELHAQGRLTDEEFERAKASIIGRISARRPTDGTAAP